MFSPFQCISVYSAAPRGSQDMFYSPDPWLALCNGQPSLPGPGRNWTSPVKASVAAAAHLHGPASTNCHWGLPDAVRSLRRSSRSAKSAADSWLTDWHHKSTEKWSRQVFVFCSSGCGARGHALAKLCLMTWSWQYLQRCVWRVCAEYHSFISGPSHALITF